MGFTSHIFGKKKAISLVARDASFKMLEPSGSAMIDSTGNGNNGVYVNTVLFDQPGPTPGTKSVKFVKAANGHIRFPGANPLFSIGTGDLTDTDWSITFWLKRAATEPDFFISKRGALPEWQARNFGLIGSEMYSRAQFTNRLSLNSGSLVMTHNNAFNFFAFVYDRSNQIVRRVQNTNFSEIPFPEAWTNIALTTDNLFLGSDRGNATFASETWIAEINIVKGKAWSLEELEKIRTEI